MTRINSGQKPMGRPPKPVEMPDIPYQECPSSAFQWYIIVAIPHRETDAVKNLADNGFRTWIPYCLREKRHARQTKVELEPLWSPYLFVGLNARQGLAEVRETIGVLDVMRSDQRVAQTIDAGLLQELWRWIDEQGGAVPLMRPTKGPWVNPGEGVNITSGPLAGFYGICSWSSADRVKILLDIMGSRREISIPAEAVIRAR